MAFDFKKEYKEFYLPKAKPELVTVPPMNYIAVRGKGDPNEEDGAYKQAIGLLYGIAYTIKMSKKGSHQIDGYFDFVVPPLEGFWQQSGSNTIDYAHKEISSGSRSSAIPSKKSNTKAGMLFAAYLLFACNDWIQKVNHSAFALAISAASALVNSPSGSTSFASSSCGSPAKSALWSASASTAATTCETPSSSTSMRA